MCGIVGFIGEPNPELLKRMTDALSHRGPDGAGTWSSPDSSVHLGHRRLSIVDIGGGHQPMICSDPLRIISFNGEIYNHRELRTELEGRGHQFRSSHSDTEVILRAHVEWGDAMVTRFNGMWAFALYDPARRRLLLSRDRFGKKPLYYSSGNGWLAFASEPGALALHPAVDTSLSRVGLMKFMAHGFIPAPHTQWTSIRKLPAGCQINIDIASCALHLERYWEFLLEPDDSLARQSDETLTDELEEKLQSAVRRRMVADVPVGCFLSGGIDSSTIAALAKGSDPNGPVRTFSIGFDDPSFDESGPAAAVAEALGTRHHCETLSLDAARHLLPDLLHPFDEALGDPSLLPTWLVSRNARRSVKVVLGGDGADELFCGYDPFRALAPARAYSALVPSPVHRMLRCLLNFLPVSHRNMSLDFKIKRALRGLDYPPHLWAPLWMAPMDLAGLAELFGHRVEAEDIFAEAIAAWSAGRGTGWEDALTQFFVRLYLQEDILPKVDRASMRHGLEARSPFLDIDLVNFIRRLPLRARRRGGVSKWLLRRVASRHLPQWVIERRKKGFGVPVGAWFANGSLHIQSDRLPSTFDRAVVQKMSSSHLAARADERGFLWNCWVLQSSVGQQPHSL